MSAPYRLSYQSPGSTASNFDLAFGVEADSVDGAIAVKEGCVFITKGSAAALTLAVPTAGLPNAGGDDGRVLQIKSTGAFAHTVTTPANGINGNKHVATFSGAVTDYIELIAYNGVWTTGGMSGITLS